MNPNPKSLSRLTSLAAIQVAGPDARSFLQGQLSNDLLRLTPQQCLLAACNSPQGRVQAVLRLLERDDGILLILPNDLLEQTLLRLKKYLLRAKATVTDSTPALEFFAAAEQAVLAQELPAPPPEQAHIHHRGVDVLRWRPGEDRYLILKNAAAKEPAGAADADEAWRLADIRAGLPQVFPMTHELFVAQMLNLDLLDGIAFDKGCYTGQEIIARTHYRGAIKRRMFRFRASSTPPAAGIRILTAEAHVGDVVMSAATDGGCELLAVIQLAHLDAPLKLQHSHAELTRLELPYAVPASDE